MSDRPPLARTSDPASSHIANAAIAADARLADHIEHAARRLAPQWFDDTDLLELVEQQTGRRQQRNVIARSRGLMERDGKFERVGLVHRGTRKTMHFCLPGQREPKLFDEEYYDPWNPVEQGRYDDDPNPYDGTGDWS